MQLNAGQLQYIRLAQPVSGTQVVQGQIQTLATNAQQVRAPAMQALGWIGSWPELASGCKGGLSNSSRHLTLWQEPPPHTLLISSPKGQTGFIGRLDSKCVSCCLTLVGQRNVKEGRSQGHLKKA